MSVELGLRSIQRGGTEVIGKTHQIIFHRGWGPLLKIQTVRDGPNSQEIDNWLIKNRRGVNQFFFDM